MEIAGAGHKHRSQASSLQPQFISQSVRSSARATAALAVYAHHKRHCVGQQRRDPPLAAHFIVKYSRTVVDRKK